MYCAPFQNYETGCPMGPDTCVQAIVAGSDCPTFCPINCPPQVPIYCGNFDENGCEIMGKCAISSAEC